MGAVNAVWGIDVGQCALKAIKLRLAEGGKVEALAFDVIEHPKILSQPDADREELIKSALEKFASRNDWQGDRFVVGIPGQQTFARFCKMPPIDLKKDAKKIPELVRYEASQQIPFDMDDVVWDYQVFTSDASPDIEVGIFAIRKDLIRKHLGYFSAVGIAPSDAQAVPAALYNFCGFDGQLAADGGATVIVDVGSQNTDLIIVEPNAAWTRNIPLGGNNFTEALVRAFKLSFAKAESLKRSAATSKYARQIFQAMRPVFAELVAEIQRSIGFYSSTHRDVELKKVLALGNAFRLPGLQKYLENNLTIPGGVVKLEKFNQVIPNATIAAPQFSENVLSFAAAYGLALQGLGLARIQASLLPPEMARIAVWQKKRPYFIATAASLALAAVVPWVANALDRQALSSERSQAAQAKAQAIVDEARRYAEEFRKATTDTSARDQDIQNLLKLQNDKLVIPRLLAAVHEALPPVDPQQADLFSGVRSAADIRKKIEANPTRYKRSERGQLLIESLSIQHVPDVEAARLDTEPGGGGPSPGPIVVGGASPWAAETGHAADQEGQADLKAAGFIVRIEGRLLFSTIKSHAVSWLERTYFANLRQSCQKPGLGFYIPEHDPGDRARRAFGEPVIRPYHQDSPRDPVNPNLPRVRGGPEEPPPASPFVDPVTGEDSRSDWRVSMAFKVWLGEMPKTEPRDQQPEQPQP